MQNFFDVAAVDSLEPGRCRTVEVNGRRLALINVGGTFHALDDTCPHRGAPLGAGYVEGARLFCPMHGWEFDATSGACLTRPDQPVNHYATMIRDGRVWVSLQA